MSEAGCERGNPSDAVRLCVRRLCLRQTSAVPMPSSTLASNADMLRLTIAASNVTVLTSSTTNEFSREDDKWNNGAFTKVLLDALGKDADENHDGLISMSELTHYVATHVSGLTDGQQHPGVEQRYEGELFIAGQ
jgi:uncharacterized caspase-like protein